MPYIGKILLLRLGQYSLFELLGFELGSCISNTKHAGPFIKSVECFYMIETVKASTRNTQQDCVIAILVIVCWFLCRRHPTPTREMLEPLLQTAAAVGLHLDVSSSKALADSLDHAVVNFILHLLLLLFSSLLFVSCFPSTIIIYMFYG